MASTQTSRRTHVTHKSELSPQWSGVLQHPSCRFARARFTRTAGVDAGEVAGAQACTAAVYFLAGVPAAVDLTFDLAALHIDTHVLMTLAVGGTLAIGGTLEVRRRRRLRRGHPVRPAAPAPAAV